MWVVCLRYFCCHLVNRVNFCRQCSKYDNNTINIVQILLYLAYYLCPVLVLFICVSVPPTVYNIKNVTQSEGLSTTLVCLSWGDPPPEMTYRKEGRREDYLLGSNVIYCYFCSNVVVRVNDCSMLFAVI